MTDVEVILRLAVALALGLAVGVERGWHQRAAEAGSRAAGVRTFALTGLLGGLAQLLSAEAGGPFPLGVLLGGLTLTLAVAYALTAAAHKGFGLTTEVSGLLTFVTGALAVAGRPLVAAAGAIAALSLLRAKSALHAWVGRLRSEELRAATLLALLSVVVLPLLPREPVDPWGVVDLRAVWWMVILVALVSFMGYAATRATGPRRGLLLTAVFGAMASSTGVALTFARRARASPEDGRVFGAGVAAASAVMPLRILLLVALGNPALLPSVLAPMLAASAAAAGMARLLWPGQALGPHPGLDLRNPLDLGTAVLAGGTLVVVLLAGEALRRTMGPSGLYALSAVSAVVGVDAITLSVARLSRGEVALPVAAGALALAAAANLGMKTTLAFAVGGSRMGRAVAATALAMIACGAASWWALGSWRAA